MEVILLQKVEKLGSVGDVVAVKNGFARNYLIPQNKALRATNENKEYFASKKAAIEKENNAKKKQAEADAEKFKKLFAVLIRQAAEDGRLYGSVAAKDIAVASSKKADVVVDKKQVLLTTPIKYIGIYPVKVLLHPEVQIVVNVNVARSVSEAKEAEKAFLNPKKDEKTEKTEEVEAKDDKKAKSKKAKAVLQEAGKKGNSSAEDKKKKTAKSKKPVESKE